MSFSLTLHLDLSLLVDTILMHPSFRLGQRVSSPLQLPENFPEVSRSLENQILATQAQFSNQFKSNNLSQEDVNHTIVALCALGTMHNCRLSKSELNTIFRSDVSERVDALYFQNRITKVTYYSGDVRYEANPGMINSVPAYLLEGIDKAELSSNYIGQVTPYLPRLLLQDSK